MATSAAAVDGGHWNATQAPCWECASPLPTAPVFKASSVVRVTVLAVIGVLSLGGNAATLASIRSNRRRRRSSLYLLLAQLAVADLLVAFFCVLAEAAWTWSVQWRAGDAACKLVKFLQMFALYLSTFILVVIAFDRFAAVRFPMRRANARRAAARMVATAWGSAALLSLPQVFIFRVQRGPFAEEFYQCVTYGFYSARWQEQLYTSMSLVCMFLLPLATLVTTYMCTFYTISVQRSAFSPATASKPDSAGYSAGLRAGGAECSGRGADDARRRLLHRAKMKSLMITVVIVAAFIVCWTPYYCMMIILIFLEPDDQLTEELQAGIFFFGSSTALINPLIYGVFHLRHQRAPRGSRHFNSSAASRAADNSVLLPGSLNRREPGEDSTRSGRVSALLLGNGCSAQKPLHPATAVTDRSSRLKGTNEATRPQHAPLKGNR